MQLNIDKFPHRAAFEELYGVPADVDAVWAARDKHQDMLNTARDHIAMIEKAIWFGHRKASRGR